MLSLNGISTGYVDVNVIKGVSIDCHKGELLGILGANGAGKTALLRAISGLNPVRAGKVELDGEDVTNLKPSSLVARGLVQVPQGRLLFGEMTVLENLEIGAYLLSDRQETGKRLNGIFGMFPILADRRYQRAAFLSGGEQQMLAVGRALMAKPKILVLDEPSIGLAPIVFNEILAKVEEINRDGTSVIIAEQNARKILRFVDRAYILEAGRVAFSGSAAELLIDERIINAYLGTNH